jgi:hypothetical protein
MRRHHFSPVLALAIGIATWAAAGTMAAVDPPSVMAEINWYKLNEVWQSTDPAFSTPFGGAVVTGANATAMLVNGQLLQATFGSFRFAQTPALRAEVQICLDRAMSAANLMETQAMAGNPGGRNTQFRMRVTGAITVNSGNSRVTTGDWTILEVASFKTMVCTVSTFIP